MSLWLRFWSNSHGYCDTAASRGSELPTEFGNTAYCTGVSFGQSSTSPGVIGIDLPGAGALALVHRVDRRSIEHGLQGYAISTMDGS